VAEREQRLMPAPTIYRSGDANAPVLFGGPGSLISLLDAVLVNGYGSTFASGVLTSDGTAPAVGDTVTVGSITYTFVASVASGAAYGVLVGTALASILSLSRAINGTGTAGSDYTAGTLPNPDAWATGTTSPLTISARKGGTTGNSIALSRAAAGTPHYSVSGATLTGGGGTDSKSGAGWAKAYSGAFGQAAYRPPAGTRFYLQVDDTGPGPGTMREARCFGWETMSAWNTGTGQFPTVAQVPAGASCRKSVTVDAAARGWTVFVDDRTLVLFTYTNDGTALAHGFSFGDFYSLLPGDAYKCLIMGGNTETNGTASTTAFFSEVQPGVTTLLGHWLPRNFAGAGGSTIFIKMGDPGLAQLGVSGSDALKGNLAFPNPADGGLYVAPLRIIDYSPPGAALGTVTDLRGRVRGLYHMPHPITGFADGDTFTGIGDYAGRAFTIVKGVNGGMIAVETTAWDTST
jgi:hypothetical protein